MPTVKLTKKTTYKKKTTKQKQKQKQIQNVTVNVHQARPVTRRRSNNTPPPKPHYPQSSNVSLNMPLHHTFYVDRPQRHALQAPDNSIQQLEAPSNSIEPLEAPEEKEKKKAGRPLGSKNREKIYAEAVEAIPAEPVKHYDAFQQDLMNTLEQRRKKKLEDNNIPIVNEVLKENPKSNQNAFQQELNTAIKQRKDRLENNSNEAPHKGLNVSSSSLMNPPQSPEQNLENLVSNVETPQKSIQKESMSGGNIDYDSMKIKDLKQLCQDHNLPVYGNKSDLIERLLLNEFGESKTRPYKKKAQTK